jgi:hypothetical protein
MVEIANQVSLAFDKPFCVSKRSHEPRCVIGPLTYWLKKTSDEKRGIPKTLRGFHKDLR